MVGSWRQAATTTCCWCGRWAAAAPSCASRSTRCVNVWAQASALVQAWVQAWGWGWGWAQACSPSALERVCVNVHIDGRTHECAQAAQPTHRAHPTFAPWSEYGLMALQAPSTCLYPHCCCCHCHSARRRPACYAPHGRRALSLLCAGLAARGI